MTTETGALLEGLDDIDWAQLAHAYGSASDVPQLIRDRASQDPEAVKNADYEFYGNIWHQGTIYAVTPTATRFLLRLLFAEATLDRPGLALLVGTLVRGNQRSTESGEIRAQTMAEVIPHVDALWALLAADDRLLSTVAYLLAGLPSTHPQLPARLLPLIAACRNDEACASMVNAMVEATRGSDTAHETFTELLGSDSMPVRFAAAIGLCLGTGQKNPQQLSATILEQLSCEHVFETTSQYWAWSTCQELVGEVLRHADRAFARAFVTETLSSLPSLDGYAASCLAYDALPLFFDASSPCGLSSLTDTQAALLVQFARDTNVLYSDETVRRILKDNHAKNMAQLAQRVGSPVGAG